MAKNNNITLLDAFKTMFKEMKSGKTIYLAFSRVSFYILIFVMAMSIIANIVLLDLLIHAPTIVQKTDSIIFVVQFLLSISAVVAGLWLFLKGVNIVTEK